MLHLGDAVLLLLGAVVGYVLGLKRDAMQREHTDRRDLADRRRPLYNELKPQVEQAVKWIEAQTGAMGARIRQVLKVDRPPPEPAFSFDWSEPVARPW